MASGGGAVLAGGGAKPKPHPPAPPKPTPSVDDLTAPTEGCSARELLRIVQKNNGAVLQLSELFESRFADLVTEGRADEYAPLCETFKPLFGACSANLSRVEAALAAPQPALASMVKTCRVAEERRFELELQRQVLRQRMSRAEDEEQQELRKQLKAVEAEQGGRVEVIRETLEELRAEEYDLEE